jgi:hypothetical protein
MKHDKQHCNKADSLLIGLLSGAAISPVLVMAICAWWLFWLDWIDDTGHGPASPTPAERTAPNQQAEREPAYWINESWVDEGPQHGPA